MSKIKKILLINPFIIETDSYNFETVISGGQFAESPLGLGYISSYLKSKINDVEVEIFDANLMAMKYIISKESSDTAVNEGLSKNKKSKIFDANLMAMRDSVSKESVDMLVCWDLIKNKIEEFSPDLVGVSSLFHSTSHIVHQTCALIKKMSPETITVIGGSYPTISYEGAVKDKNIDYAVIGEGEVCFTNLILFLNGKKEAEDLHGIAYRDGKKVISKPNNFFIKDLDELPFPDRTNISPDDYIMPNDFSEYGNLSRNFLFRVLDRNKTKIGIMTASRGCPYSCSFCSAKHIWGRSIRYRSPKNVVDEIEILVKDYGVNAIVFNDDNFTVDSKKATAIMDEIIKRGLNIRWGAGGGLGANHLDEETIEKMYKSGIAIFNLAFESGNQKTLKQIGKVLNLEISKDVVKRIRQMGDGYIIGFFISGFHFETKKEVEETLKFAQSLDLDWSLIRNYQAIPGSRVFEECIQKGYVVADSIRYGYPLVTSNVDWPNFSKEYILERNYLANLEVNFINSRNLKHDRVDQAIRDFKGVIELAPDHAIAYYVLGKAYKTKGQDSKVKASWLKAKEILKTSSDSRGYFKHFKIDIDKELALLERGHSNG